MSHAGHALAGGVHPGQLVTGRDHGVEQGGRVRAAVPVGDDRSRQSRCAWRW
ncbi:MAG TPA: hypothetical protein VG011_04750 [Steroidobacteraceae bacterium]|nr:hypothetical protein [Steroidobacteraceae bacterium]